MGIILMSGSGNRRKISSLSSMTKLLLHADGSDNSTTIIDSSIYNVNISVFGSTVIKTAQSKFGGSSLYTNAVGNYITATIPTIGTQPFTFEFFLYQESGGSNDGILQFNADATMSVYYYQNILYIRANSTDYTIISNPTQNTWHHVAIVRTSTNGAINVYYDGVLKSTITSYNITGTLLTLGYYFSTIYRFIGYLDEFRYVLGLGMYTGNFTPPTAPFNV